MTQFNYLSRGLHWYTKINQILRIFNFFGSSSLRVLVHFCKHFQSSHHLDDSFSIDVRGRETITIHHMK